MILYFGLLKASFYSVQSVKMFSGTISILVIQRNFIDSLNERKMRSVCAIKQRIIYKEGVSTSYLIVLILGVGYRGQFLVMSLKFSLKTLDHFIRVCGDRKYQKYPDIWKIQDAQTIFRRLPWKWPKFLKNWYLSNCLSTYVLLYQDWSKISTCGLLHMFTMRSCYVVK